MRVQYTMDEQAVRAIAVRSKSLGLHPGRLVEYVMTQWLRKNEAVTLTPDPVLSIGGVAMYDTGEQASRAEEIFQPGVRRLNPDVDLMTPSGKRRVDRVTFRMPICAECTLEVTEDQIGPGDMHVGCPGRI